ncbi:MAG: hypothetical protein ACK53Y_25700, partial [bacterium]
VPLITLQWIPNMKHQLHHKSNRQSKTIIHGCHSKVKTQREQQKNYDCWSKIPWKQKEVHRLWFHYKGDQSEEFKKCDLAFIALFVK